MEFSLLAEGTEQFSLFSVLAATWQASKSHAHILPSLSQMLKTRGREGQVGTQTPLSS